MRNIWYKTAINEALKEEMEKDGRVFLIGEDVDIHGGVFKISRGLLEKFGRKRVRGTPISESAFIGLAAGAAMTGLRPVVEIMYMDFALVAMDQLVNQALSVTYMSGGKVNVPMVIRGQYGTETSEAAQHSRQFESWFMNTPGVKIAMPATAYDAKGLLKSAIRDENPILYLENRVLYQIGEDVPEGDWLVPFGEASVRRQGNDITIVATGNMVRKALEAAGSMAGSIDAEVIDPRTLVPLDIETILESVKKTGSLLISHDANPCAGFGAEVVRLVCEQGFQFLKKPPRVLGAHPVPTPFSPVLEKAYIPQPDDIVRETRIVLGR